MEPSHSEYAVAQKSSIFFGFFLPITPGPFVFIQNSSYSLCLPGVLVTCTSEILHKPLDIPLVTLHSYVPKSESFSGVTTKTPSNACTFGDCVTVWLSFVQEYSSIEPAEVVVA